MTSMFGTKKNIWEVQYISGSKRFSRKSEAMTYASKMLQTRNMVRIVNINL